MVEHTFLLREGVWRVEGEHIDALGKRTGVEGEAEILHYPDKWVSSSVMRTKTAQPIESHSVYHVHPFVPGNITTPWSSQSPSLGGLNGHFLLLGDAILSTWESATGRFRGSETMLMRDPAHYSARGALFEGGKLMSAWVVELRSV
jgi:hypothetical protein